MSEILWNLEQVCCYGNNHTIRLDRISTEIRTGITAVLGPSGAGKTSLLNLLVQFEQPDSGTIQKKIKRKNENNIELYWIPQDYGLWPDLTVNEHLQLVNSTITDESRNNLMQQFGLSAHSHKLPGYLSKGEQARLAVARALAAEPAVLVMDEALVHVDQAVKTRIWDYVLNYVKKQNISLIFSTHNHQEVVADANNVICLKNGKISYAGTVEQLYDNPASPETAGFMGEFNWLDDKDIPLWTNNQKMKPGCVRPENMQIKPDRDSALYIKKISFRSSITEIELLHQPTKQTRLFFTRQPGRKLSVNQQVSVHLL